MSKLAASFTALLAAAIAPGMGTVASAAMLGPHGGQCDGRHPAMLVHVIGLKGRGGIVRVQSYGGDPAGFLEKGTYLERLDLAPPAAGAVEVCVPVPRPGVYAISVRHKTEGSSEMDDGGGLSGNPHRSVMDLVFRRKPDPREISVRVAGVVTVPIVMNYLQGGSFKPIKTAER